MSLASRIVNIFSSTSKEETSGQPQQHPTSISDVLSGFSGTQLHIGQAERNMLHSMSPEVLEAEEEPRPSYLHAMIAGGIGGTSGDLLMHSLDTVKTRQQGDLHIPPKYTTLPQSYSTIFRQEGGRGLYGGWIPALVGSFPGTVIFFGTYEYSKRNLIDLGCNHHFAHFTSGLSADLAASVIYVPSEVLKTRLQLQGRYNNPHFNSGYNYRSTRHALSTLIRTEGPAALYSGYWATIYRDLPFSALQFAFYEQGQKWSRQWKKSKDIGWQLEVLTGASAGGLAGVITCPLDVVKTRIQTQVPEVPSQSVTQQSPPKPPPHTNSPATIATTTHSTANPSPTSQPSISHQAQPPTNKSTPKIQFRNISTSSPSTHRPRPGAINLNTSSVVTGLKVIYKTEGISGWFRGVGPRLVWTSVQSGVMLTCYQKGLKFLEERWPVEEGEEVYGRVG